jgi:Fe2+ or Zn2+ uptake regulation protein
VIFEVLHEDSICRSVAIPSSRGSRRGPLHHQVVCGDCGRSGMMADPGNEDQVRQEWADWHGFEVHMFHGQYVVQPRRRS